jgi:heme/copper-type cytochrome/quinol oxidase subunit 2
MEEKKNEKSDTYDKLFYAAIIIIAILLFIFGVLVFIFLSHLTSK